MIDWLLRLLHLSVSRRPEEGEREAVAAFIRLGMDFPEATFEYEFYSLGSVRSYFTGQSQRVVTFYGPDQRRVAMQLEKSGEDKQWEVTQLYSATAENRSAYVDGYRFEVWRAEDSGLRWLFVPFHAGNKGGAATVKMRDGDEKARQLLLGECMIEDRFVPRW